jgi:hypothetical protein
MQDRTYQLKVNGKEIAKVQGNKSWVRDQFIAIVKNFKPEYNPAFDILEITDVSLLSAHTAITHLTNHNTTMDGRMIKRHINNLIETYGEDKLLEVLKEVYGVERTIIKPKAI